MSPVSGQRAQQRSIPQTASTEQCCHRRCRTKGAESCGQDGDGKMLGCDTAHMARCASQGGHMPCSDASLRVCGMSRHVLIAADPSWWRWWWGRFVCGRWWGGGGGRWWWGGVLISGGGGLFQLVVVALAALAGGRNGGALSGGAGMVCGNGGGQGRV